MDQFKLIIRKTIIYLILLQKPKSDQNNLSNFDLRYDLNLEEIGINIDKLIKFSAPEKDKKTIFVWPEGVFSGYNFDEIKIFKNKFNKNFNKKSLNNIWY